MNRGAVCFIALLGLHAMPRSTLAMEGRIVHETRVIRGESMAPLLQHGQTVRVVLFPPAGRPVLARDDIVLYRVAGRDAPLLKSIKAVPGDTFRMIPSMNGWQVLINGRICVNSQGRPYRFDARRARMLQLYERDYQGVVPAQAYLLFGDAPHGSLDSTQFGLIHAQQMIGIVYE